ncbi:hypothetical protein [Streptomyces sp. NPDC008125]|uniref:hypothetical protein n=1 Tax=Streptomyces sp. NPDC008125 TaxID=3364811 RepID=UPI0036ED9578
MSAASACAEWHEGGVADIAFHVPDLRAAFDASEPAGVGAVRARGPGSVQSERLASASVSG